MVFATSVALTMGLTIIMICKPFFGTSEWLHLQFCNTVDEISYERQGDVGCQHCYNRRFVAYFIHTA